MRCRVGWTTVRPRMRESQKEKRVRDTGEEGGKNEVDSYDGDASKNVARIDAAATFHFDDADGGVAFSI